MFQAAWRLDCPRGHFTLSSAPTTTRHDNTLDSRTNLPKRSPQAFLPQRGKRGKRGWRKLHIGVTGEGEIVAQVLTDSNVGDAKAGVELIEQVEGDIKSVTGDAACDTAAVYDAVGARGAIAVEKGARIRSRIRSQDQIQRLSQPRESLGSRLLQLIRIASGSAAVPRGWIS
jgi:hypothetical protein